MAPTPRIWGRRLVALAAVVVVGLAIWLLVAGGGDGEPGVSDDRGADVRNLTVLSEAVSRDQPVTVVVPQSTGGDRPLLVFLHGRGGDETSEIHQALFDALEGVGERAPIVALPDGGDSSFWHDRSSGDWSEYVTAEVIPQVVDEVDADPDRIAIGGISMGGYGAYQIAYENPGMFCAVGGHSPALWQTAAETPEGAFDDAEDFETHDVIGAVAEDPSPLTSQPIWLDIGDEDPFLAGADAFTAELEAAGAEITDERPSGGHDSSYWQAHWAEYMAFYANSLADCRRN